MHRLASGERFHLWVPGLLMKSILSGVPTSAELVSTGMAGVALPIEFIELSHQDLAGQLLLWVLNRFFDAWMGLYFL